MSSFAPIFIHPLLGADEAWSGYRVEFAPGSANPDALTRLYSSPILDTFDHRHPWLLPATPGSSVVSRLGERAITVFPAQTPAEESEASQALESGLRQARQRVGLIASPENKLPGAGAWDYLLIGISQARTLPPFTLIGIASRTQLIATEVHSHADRAWALDNACSLTTSEFLLTRNANDKKADTTRVKLLQLLALIASDADTGQLEAIFREEAKLSYSLLRLVNSAAIAPRSPITSFAQAINLLGRRQLQRWLQLLVYADPNNGQKANPLLQKAAARGRLLELLAPILNPAPIAENLADAAFMIGTFSLLDVLLNMSMSEILQHLPLSGPVHEALATHGGALGKLLRAADSIDSNDLKTASEIFNEQGISSAALLDAQLDALSWAEKIRPTN